MGMIQEFQQADEERRREVADICGEVATIRGEVATMLKDLAKGSAQRRSEVDTMRSGVATMLKEFTTGDIERKAEVAAIAEEAAAIVEEADTFVKDLAKGSAQRHTEVWGTALARKVAAPPVEELPAEMPAEEAVVEAAPAGELRYRVFSYLADHPDGTKLVELEEEFGVARIQIARVIRELIDNNKVEKRNLLYFAI